MAAVEVAVWTMAMKVAALVNAKGSDTCSYLGDSVISISRTQVMAQEKSRRIAIVWRLSRLIRRHVLFPTSVHRHQPSRCLDIIWSRKMFRDISNGASAICKSIPVPGIIRLKVMKRHRVIKS